MVWQLISSWLTAWLAALAVALWWGLHIFPRSEHWAEFRSMVIADAPVGDSVVMSVDRSIYRPVFGEWVVVVRRQRDDGWAVYCTAQGQSDYQPDAVFPYPLTLNWWTEGQCSLNNPGLYFVTTTWTFYPGWVAGPRVSPPLVSNTFRIVEVE
jgi:hypothetical protein